MNKLLTIAGGSFFIIEAVAISAFLLEVSKEAIQAFVPWFMFGAVNVAFLIILMFGAFRKE